MQNKRDIRWAAGLYEGEGWCSTAHNHARANKDGTRRHYRYVDVGLGTTDEDIVKEFARVIGSGRIHGPYHTKGMKPIWIWRAKNSEAKSILTRLLPYLGTRRAQVARAAIELQTGRIDLAG